MNSKPMQFALLGLVAAAFLLVAYALRPGSAGAWGGTGLHDDSLAARAADNESGGALRVGANTGAAAGDNEAQPDADIAPIVDAARESLRQNNLASARLLLDTAQSVHPNDPRVLSLQRDLQARTNLAGDAAPVPAPSNRTHTTKRAGGSWHGESRSGRKLDAAQGAAATAAASSTNGRNMAGTSAAVSTGSLGQPASTKPVAPGIASDASKAEATTPHVMQAGSVSGSGDATTPAAFPAAMPGAAQAVATPTTIAAPDTAAPAAVTAPAAGIVPVTPAAPAVMPATPAAPDNAAPLQPQAATARPVDAKRVMAVTPPAQAAKAAITAQAPRTRAEINAELDSARKNGDLPKFGNPDPAGPGGALSYTGAQQHGE